MRLSLSLYIILSVCTTIWALSFDDDEKFALKEFSDEFGLDWDISSDFAICNHNLNFYCIEEEDAYFIDLMSQNLIGTIPESFNNLKRMIGIYLSDNYIMGSLPTFEGFSKIEDILLNSNLLNGTIPNTLKTLPSLVNLDLGNNMLSGNIDGFNMPYLKRLYLNRNKFSGTLVPESWELPSLERLVVTGNEFEGAAPLDKICDQFSKINYLSLAENMFNVPLSLANGKCQNLEYLYINNNNFGGTLDNLHLPPSIKVFNAQNSSLTGGLSFVSGLTNLESLVLEYNELSNDFAHFAELTNLKDLLMQGNKFGGELPLELADLHQLERIYLGENEIVGSIPSEYNCENWPYLTILALNDNKLNGSISDFSQCDYMTRLYLYNNQLEGSVDQLSALKSIEIINLSDNKFEGNISIFNSLQTLRILSLNRNNFFGDLSLISDLTNLESLYMNNNTITGSVSNLLNYPKLEIAAIAVANLTGPIPDEIGNLSNLLLLHLFANQLDGTIPSSLGNLNSLQLLEIHNNRFTGNIPKELGNLKGLRSLNLFKNQLTGSIPSELGNLSELEFLALASNKLEGNLPSTLNNLKKLRKVYIYENGITGNIDVLFSLPNLEILSAFSCKLSGQLSNDMTNLSKLSVFSIRDNMFSGELPKDLGTLERLYFIDISNNRLRGTIPSSLELSPVLMYLYFHDNQFSGNIPSFLGNIESLVHLSLLGNKFYGEIPSSIYQLPNLEGLWLGDNFLTGQISEEIGNLINLKYLYLQNNRLSGTIPSELGELEFLFSVDLSNNNFSGKAPDFNQNNLAILRLNNLCLSGCPPSIAPSVLLCEMVLTTFDIDSEEEQSCEYLEYCKYQGGLTCNGTINEVHLTKKTNITSEVIFSNSTIIKLHNNSYFISDNKVECDYKSNFSKEGAVENTNSKESCSCVNFDHTRMQIQLDNKPKKGEEYNFTLVEGCSGGVLGSINIISPETDLCFKQEIDNQKGLHMVLRVKVESCSKNKHLKIVLPIVIFVVIGAAVGVALFLRYRLKKADERIKKELSL